MFIKIFFALNMLMATQPDISETPRQPATPEIISIHTDFPQDGIWVLIPKGTKEITFHVEAKNTETVLFWLIPTGTQTWTERELIGYVKNENLTDNHFTFTWKIDKPSLHDHLHIQAIGEGVANDIINLTMQ